VNPEIQIVGGAGPRETAAIMAALARLAEEQAWAAAFPAPRPEQGPWVLSGRPAPVGNPFVNNPGPTVRGWGIGSNGDD
jgi:hypothetical protein